MVDVYCEIRARYISMTSHNIYVCGNLMGVTFFVSIFLYNFVVNLQKFVALDKKVRQPMPLNSSLFELRQCKQTYQISRKWQTYLHVME
jgi:hypothetical protein